MPKRSSRERSASTQERILQAAMEVFGSKNYHWATTKEIAERAGVSERMLFFYFTNKKELYREVVRRATQDMVDAVLRAAPPQSDIRAFIKMSQRNFLAYLKEHPYKVKVLFQNFDVIGDPDMKRDFREIMQRLYDLFFNIMEEARERGEILGDLHVGILVVYVLGFQVIVSSAELLGLDWFEGEHRDVFTIADIFADYITGRKGSLLS